MSMEKKIDTQQAPVAPNQPRDNLVRVYVFDYKRFSISKSV
jgi:hypothetical protein